MWKTSTTVERKTTHNLNFCKKGRIGCQKCLENGKNWTKSPKNENSIKIHNLKSSVTQRLQTPCHHRCRQTPYQKDKCCNYPVANCLLLLPSPPVRTLSYCYWWLAIWWSKWRDWQQGWPLSSELATICFAVITTCTMPGLSQLA